MIQGFSHIGIGVSDLARSINFYSEVFGFTELYQLDFENNEVAATMEQEGAFKSAMLLRGDVRIELLQWVDVPITGSGERKPMTELGFTHLSFRVDEIDDLTEAVLANAAPCTRRRSRTSVPRVHRRRGCSTTPTRTAPGSKS